MAFKEFIIVFGICAMVFAVATFGWLVFYYIKKIIKEIKSNWNWERK